MPLQMQLQLQMLASQSGQLQMDSYPSFTDMMSPDQHHQMFMHHNSHSKQSAQSQSAQSQSQSQSQVQSKISSQSQHNHYMQPNSHSPPSNDESNPQSYQPKLNSKHVVVEQSVYQESSSSRVSANSSKRQLNHSSLVCLPPLQDIVQDAPKGLNATHGDLPWSHHHPQQHVREVMYSSSSSAVGAYPTQNDIPNKDRHSPQSPQQERKKRHHQPNSDDHASAPKKSSGASSTPKAKRPTEVNPYIAYCTQKRAQVRRENPFASNREILLMVGEMWRNETEDERRKFERIARDMTIKNLTKT
eukprot:TRINITY_DN679_c0_g1_i3.p2 TRINITY_DN679_c0_g1~~TRINITY_DN679_c0_g1_i3.p2  ORF type:complete len:302 (-),score=74.31 TRINITY_DN679_c0_g1_i3:667-1572(-)